MKTTDDLLFKLKHAGETGEYAVLSADEAKALRATFQRREGLLREARLGIRGAPMSVRAMTPERLAAAIDEEIGT